MQILCTWTGDAFIPEKRHEKALDAEMPTVESFRKAGLIACGYCHKVEAVCATNQQAQALAASYTRLDDYVVVEIRDRVISVWTARSQRRNAMDAAERKAANAAVLEWAAAQVGVSSEQVKAA